MQENLQVKTGRSKTPPRGWKRMRRVQTYQALPKSRFRRILSYIFNVWTISLALIVLLIAFLTTTYYWFEFSDRIDQKLLSGEVFTPNAGIYSAPKILRAGESTTMQDLVDYLKTAGYIEKNSHADASRSRYWVDGASLVIQPGASALIDGRQAFPSVTVRFNKE